MFTVKLQNYIFYLIKSVVFILTTLKKFNMCKYRTQMVYKEHERIQNLVCGWGIYTLYQKVIIL